MSIKCHSRCFFKERHNCSDDGAGTLLKGGKEEEEGTYDEDGALAWVQHPHSLVLAGGENPGAVPVPAGTVDEVSVYTVDPHHGLPTSHVPQDHHVITGCRDTRWHKW